jgi:hypothetical protein
LDFIDENRAVTDCQADIAENERAAAFLPRLASF